MALQRARHKALSEGEPSQTVSVLLFIRELLLLSFLLGSFLLRFRLAQKETFLCLLQFNIFV